MRVERTFRSASKLCPEVQAFSPLHRFGLKALPKSAEAPLYPIADTAIAELL